MDVDTNIPEEELFVAAFVRSERRDRVRQLCRAKSRSKLRAVLAHCDWIDQRYRVDIPSASQTPSGIASLLRKHGAPERCRVMSEFREFDATEQPLDEILERVVGYGMGTILICIPERLAYYEGGDQGERYLLVR